MQRLHRNSAPYPEAGTDCRSPSPIRGMPLTLDPSPPRSSVVCAAPAAAAPPEEAGSSKVFSLPSRDDLVFPPSGLDPSCRQSDNERSQQDAGEEQKQKLLVGAARSPRGPFGKLERSERQGRLGASRQKYPDGARHVPRPYPKACVRTHGPAQLPCMETSSSSGRLIHAHAPQGIKVSRLPPAGRPVLTWPFSAADDS